MKKAALIFVTLFAFCALGYAGSEPMASGKEMKQVVPVASECPSWTGFYIGAFGGYKFGVFDPRIDVQEDGGNETEDERLIESHLGDDFSADGGEFGGLIGFNFQLNKLVLGLEAAGGYVGLRNSETGRFAVPDSDDIYALSNSLKSHYLITLGPRFGYAVCNWLPYVTGGVAFGDLDFRQRISETDDFDQRRSDDGTNVGWFVGGGLQYALTRHWSVRAQYQYIDLGGAGVRWHVSDELTGTSGVNLREHNASFAIIFGF
jgi:outer membrane immunogenic protein